MPKVPRLPSDLTCSAGCDARQALACTLREERRLRADIKLATGSPDAEVLAGDLRTIERRVDAILDYARMMSR